MPSVSKVLGDLASSTGSISVAAGSNTAPAITTSGDTNTGMFFPAADTIAFAEGGAEAMRLDANGNMGIGVTPQTWYTGDALQIGSYSAISDLSTATRINNNAYYNAAGSVTYLNTAAATEYTAGGGTHTWKYAASGTAGNPITWTTAMTINSSGQTSISNLSAFQDPEGVFTVNGNSCGEYIGAINNRNTSNCNPAHGLIFRAGYNGSASGSNYFSFRRPDNTVTGSITQSGSTTISFTTSSDYRLKENIIPMTGALAKVSALKPVTYTWKEDGSAGQGFIAHELQEVVSDCVVGEKDAVDAEGNPQYQGVDTSFLVATLTAAIQEQQAIINDLKARVETLEAN